MQGDLRHLELALLDVRPEQRLRRVGSFLHHGAQDRGMFDVGRFDAIDALEIEATNDADALGDVSKQARHLIEQIRAFQAGRPSSGLARTLANTVVTIGFDPQLSYPCINSKEARRVQHA